MKPKLNVDDIIESLWSDAFSLNELGEIAGAVEQVRGARMGSPLQSPADYDKVKSNVEALRAFLGGPMFDAFKAQVLLALILRQPNKQLTLTANEVDRTGGWSVRMEVDQIARAFTFIASKHS